MIFNTNYGIKGTSQTASMKVYAPSGSTVTASKDGKTITGTFNTDHFLISGIDKYGKWDVSVNSQVKAIDVEEAKVYDVRISGYDLLAYLESDGGQYINTGIRGNAPQSIFFDVEYQLVNAQQNKAFFILGTQGKGSSTSYNAATRFGAISGTANRMYLTLGNLERYFTPTFDNNWHTFSFPSFNSTYSTMRYDGSAVSWTNGSTSNRNVTIDFPFFLFEENQSGTPTRSALNKRIRRAKFTMGTTIWEFKAARRNSDDELGMLDVTHNVFYPNAGTGKFIAGEVTGHID